MNEIDNAIKNRKITALFPRLTHNDLGIAAKEETIKASGANSVNKSSVVIPPIVPPKISSPRIHHNVLEDPDSRPTWVRIYILSITTTYAYYN